MSGHFSEMMGELSQKDREISNLRKLAKELSDCLLTVAPLGGSECFRRVRSASGEDYYADPEFFMRRIADNRDRLATYIFRVHRAEIALREIAELPDVRLDEAGTVASRALALTSPIVREGS